MQKLYVIVRRDLTPSQQTVQGSHAVGGWCRSFSEWKNEILVMLGVTSLEQISLVEDELKDLGIPHVAFREPDIGNELTAIATIHRHPMFRKMKLL